MAEIKITDLPSDNTINNNDAFLKVSNGSTYQMSGKTLITQLSGITGAQNLGTGSSVLNYTNGATLYFNSLSGTSGISTVYNGISKTINIGISPSGVTSNAIADNSITVNKLSISGTVIQTKTFSQYVRLGINSTGWYGTGVSVAITPTKTNSKFLIRFCGLLGSYESWPYLTVYRYINGNAYDLTQSNTQGYGTYEADYSWRYTGIPISFEVVDMPNTLSTVTYQIMIRNGSGGSYWSYLGGSWYWYATVQPSTGAMVPSTLIVQEITA